MDILRSIEKNLLNVVNNNGKTNDVDLLKKDIKTYFSYIDNKADIESQKKAKYYNSYENARIVASMEYDRYLRDKEDLKNELKIEKSKTALHDYLKLKYSHANIPDIYSYQDIRLVDRVVIPRVIDKKPANKKPKKAKADVKADANVKECPDGKEINPITKRCVNKCKDGEIRDKDTGKCKKTAKKAPVPAPVPVPAPLPALLPEPIPSPVPIIEPLVPTPVPVPIKAKVKAKVLANKECPEGKEINPLTGRCVNKCKDDEERNMETGKCKKKKK